VVPVLSSGIYDRQLAEAISVNSRPASSVLQFTMPWETPFVSFVFDGLQPLAELDVDLSGGLPPTVPATKRSIVQSSPFVLLPGPKRLKRVSARAWSFNPQGATDEDAKFTRAVMKWRLIVSIAPEASRVGKQLAALAECSDPDSEGLLLLKDVFANKSPSTLCKRAGSMLRFINWAMLQNIPCAEIFPLREETSYRFLKSLRVDGAKPTAGDSFIQACGFAHGTIGLEGGQESSQSVRCKGAAFSMFTLKALLVQKDVLTVIQVQILEVAVWEARDLEDRVFAGHCLLCIFGRLRWSDSQRLTSLRMEWAEPGDDLGGFIEGTAFRTKTAKSKDARTRLLPVVIVMRTLTSRCWCTAWLEARRQAGLTVDLADLTIDGVRVPLMPSYLGADQWSMRPLQAGQAAAWLRGLLVRYGSAQDQVCNVATHSLKATVLSWCAKSGMAMAARQALGYHVVSGQLSAHTYARDAVGWPLRQLTLLLADMRKGTFNPDFKRSARFPLVPYPLNPFEHSMGIVQTPPYVPQSDHSPLPLLVGHPVSDAEDLPSDVGPELTLRTEQSFDVTSHVSDEEGSTSDALGPALTLPSDPDFDDVECQELLFMHLPSVLANVVSWCQDSQEPSFYMYDGYLTPPPVDPREWEVLSENEILSESGSSANDSLGEDSDAEADVATERVAVARRCAAGDISRVDAYRHLIRGTFHLPHSFDISKLACGRDRVTAFQACQLPKFAWPRCAICFGNDSAEP
jgi:hypothetical protein